MALKKFHKIIIFLIPLLVVILGAGYLVLRHVPAATYAPRETDSQAHWGSVSGSLSYPSEVIPAMGVCAQTVKGADMYCTYKLIQGEQYENGYGYELAVPPDTYYVFAHLVTEGKEDIGYTDEYKAYYSEFVTCGLLYECPSHKPVAVEVKRQQHVQDVDPMDWYNF